MMINKSRSNGTSSTQTFDYSAQLQPRFYQRGGWWCKFAAVVAFFLWLYGCYTNPGCPEYQKVPELQIEKFLGMWYEMYRTLDDDRTVGECVTTEFLVRSDYLIKVSNTE